MNTTIIISDDDEETTPSPRDNSVVILDHIEAQTKEAVELSDEEEKEREKELKPQDKVEQRDEIDLRYELDLRDEYWPPDETDSDDLFNSESEVQVEAEVQSNNKAESKGDNEQNRGKTKPLSKAKPKSEAKKLALLQKEMGKLQSQANKANAANKALQNCTAILDKKIVKLINDPDETILSTLFDESLLSYRFTDYPSIENSITWSFKRVEVEDGECVSKFHDSDWILVIMEGEDYFKKVLTYRDEPDDKQSIKTFISSIGARSKPNIIIFVFNLANYVKNERTKGAKNYRKTFKDRFEHSSSQPIISLNQPPPDIGLTDLQDLRLMFEMDIKSEHPDWKLHLEFHEKTPDVINSIVKYTSSIAKLEVKKKAKTAIDLDWAINMDKERAIDPAKSCEDLKKLWLAQLQQFSQVTLPIAKAIAAEYPSPSALLDIYKSLTTSEAENLLSELHVQKNLKRQIGPNISRRIHYFMTSTDPNLHIGY